MVSDRLRFAWKTETTVLQMVGIYLFSVVYTIIPFIVLGVENETIGEYISKSTLGNNAEKAFAFIGLCSFLPIVILNILYMVTLCKLRKHWRKRMRSLRQDIQNEAPPGGFLAP